MGYRGHHSAVTCSAVRIILYLVLGTTDHTSVVTFVFVCVCMCVQYRPGGSVAGQQSRRVGNEDV